MLLGGRNKAAFRTLQKKTEEAAPSFSSDSLKDVYLQYTKDDLLEIAHIHQLDHCSQMEKPDLASYLSEYILKPGAMNTENFRKRRELTWKQIQYCYYCVHIYGAAPLEHIAELYNEYEQEQITPKDLINLYFLPCPHAFSFGYHNKMFVDFMLLEDPGLLEDIASIRMDYAYYHPSREEIFQETFETHQASLKFTSYLVDELGFQITEAVDLTRRISYIMKVGADPEHIFEMLQKGDVVFADQEQADTFAGKMMGLYADTRLFIASGHTPAELEHMKHRENS